MNVHQIRQISNNFYNNYYQDMITFSQLQNGCRALIIIRALNDDLNIENEIHRVVGVILTRINQLSREIDEFNNIHHNIIIDNNRWINFREHARIFYRTMNVFAGLLLVDRGEINIPIDFQNNIYNQLGVNFNNNINNNINNNENNQYNNVQN
jgi:hypothetical protein